MEPVKCIYCEYCMIDDIADKVGFCQKVEAKKRVLQSIVDKRNCAKFNLAPIHNVQFRKEQIKKGRS